MAFSRHSDLNCTFLILVCLPLIVLIGGCERERTTVPAPGLGTNTSLESTKEEPLLLEDEPPLLLDDEPETETAAGPVADNSRCFVCHINYVQEPIAVAHARANIGCASCHGASDAHIADESWGSGGNGTAPDIMYPRGKINPACMACHPRDKIEAPHHQPAFDDADAKVCTDCHGDHRLAQRRCKWR